MRMQVNTMAHWLSWLVATGQALPVGHCALRHLGSLPDLYRFLLFEAAFPTDFGRPEISNTDQGGQFTSTAFTGVLAAAGIRISMDGRALDGQCAHRLAVVVAQA